MYKWLIFAALLATCYGGCNKMRRLKVKSQWSLAYGTGQDRFSIGTALWRSIFEQRPEAIDKYFKRVNGQDILSPKFQAHISRIFGGFDMAISLLDDEPTLNAQLNHLHSQHQEMGIPGDYFDVFRRSLMLVVESTIETCYDQKAWEVCTAVISKGIAGGV